MNHTRVITINSATNRAVGMTLQTTPTMAIIASVRASSDAARAGLKNADVITQIDNKSISSIGNVDAYLKRKKKIVLNIRRPSDPPITNNNRTSSSNNNTSANSREVIELDLDDDGPSSAPAASSSSSSSSPLSSVYARVSNVISGMMSGNNNRSTIGRSEVVNGNQVIDLLSSDDEDNTSPPTHPPIGSRGTVTTTAPSSTSASASTSVPTSSSSRLGQVTTPATATASSTVSGATAKPNSDEQPSKRARKASSDKHSNNPIRIKQESHGFTPKEFGQCDDELIEEVHNPDGDTNGGDGTSAGAAMDVDVIALDDEAIEFVGGGNALVASDMAHPRDSCTKFPFSTNGTAENNKKICNNCYCYVCDTPATECDSWVIAGSPQASHCMATHKLSKWVHMKKNNPKNQPIMSLLPASARGAFASAFAAVSVYRSNEIESRERAIQQRNRRNMYHRGFDPFGALMGFMGHYDDSDYDSDYGYGGYGGHDVTVRSMSAINESSIRSFLNNITSTMRKYADYNDPNKEISDEEKALVVDTLFQAIGFAIHAYSMADAPYSNLLGRPSDRSRYVLTDATMVLVDACFHRLGNAEVVTRAQEAMRVSCAHKGSLTTSINLLLDLFSYIPDNFRQVLHNVKLPADDANSSFDDITLPGVPEVEFRLPPEKINSLTISRDNAYGGSVLEYFMQLVVGINPLTFLAMVKSNPPLNPYYSASKIVCMMKESLKKQVMKVSGLVLITKTFEVISEMYKAHIALPVPDGSEPHRGNHAWKAWIDPLHTGTAPVFATTGSYHPFYSCKPPFLRNILRDALGLHNQRISHTYHNNTCYIFAMYDFSSKMISDTRKNAGISNTGKAKYISIILYTLLSLRKMAMEQNRDVTDVVDAQELYHASFISHYGVLPILSGNFGGNDEFKSIRDKYFVDPNNDFDPAQFYQSRPLNNANPVLNSLTEYQKCHKRLISQPWVMIQKRVAIAIDMSDVFSKMYTQMTELNFATPINEWTLKRFFNSENGLLSTRQVTIAKESSALSAHEHSVYYRQTMEAHMIAFIAYSLRHSIAKAGNDQENEDFPVQWLLAFAQCETCFKWDNTNDPNYSRQKRFAKIAESAQSINLFKMYHTSVIETSVVLCMLLMNDKFFADASGYENLNSTSEDMMDRVLASILSLPMLDLDMLPHNNYTQYTARAPKIDTDCIDYVTNLCQALIKEDAGFELLKRVTPIWSHLPDGFLQGENFKCDRYDSQLMVQDLPARATKFNGLVLGHATLGYAEELNLKHNITQTKHLPTPYCSFMFVEALVDVLTRDVKKYEYCKKLETERGPRAPPEDEELFHIDDDRRCFVDNPDISEAQVSLIKQLPAMLLKTLADLCIQRSGRRNHLNSMDFTRRLARTFQYLCAAYGVDPSLECPVLLLFQGTPPRFMYEDYGIRQLELDKADRKRILPECWDHLRGFISIVMLANRDYIYRYETRIAPLENYRRHAKFNIAVQEMIKEMITLKFTLIHASSNNEGIWEFFRSAIRLTTKIRSSNSDCHNRYDDAYFNLSRQVKPFLLLLVNEDFDLAPSLSYLQIRDVVYKNLYNQILSASATAPKKEEFYTSSTVYEFMVFYPEVLRMPCFKMGPSDPDADPMEFDFQRYATPDLRSIVSEYIIKQYKFLSPNKLYPSVQKSLGIPSARFNSFNTMNPFAMTRMLHQDKCTESNIWSNSKNMRLIMKVAALTMDPLLIVKVMRFMKRVIMSQNRGENDIPHDYRDEKNIFAGGAARYHYDSNQGDSEITLHRISYEYAADTTHDGSGWHQGSLFDQGTNNQDDGSDEWLNLHEDYKELVGFPLLSFRYLFTQDVDLPQADLRVHTWDSNLPKPHLPRSSSIFDYWTILRDSSSTYLSDAEEMELDENEFQSLWEYFNGFYLDVEKNIRILVDTSTRDTVESKSSRNSTNLGSVRSNATATFKSLMICSALGLHELMSTIMNMNSCYIPRLGDWALLIDCYDSFGALMVGPWREKNGGLDASLLNVGYVKSKELSDKSLVAKVNELDLRLLYLDKDFRMKAPALHVAMPYLSKYYKTEPLINSNHRHYREMSGANHSKLFTQIPSIVFARKLMSLTFHGWSLPLMSIDLAIAPSTLRDSIVTINRYQHNGTSFEKKAQPNPQFIENLNLHAALYEFMFYQASPEDMQSNAVYLYEKNFNKWEVTMNKWIDAYFLSGPSVQTPVMCTPITWDDKCLAKRPYLRIFNTLVDMTQTQIKQALMKDRYLVYDELSDEVSRLSRNRGTFFSTAMFLTILIKYYPKQNLIEQLNNLDLGTDVKGYDLFKCGTSRCHITIRDLALVMQEELPSKHCTGYREMITSWLAYRLLKCASIELTEKEKLDFQAFWNAVRPMVRSKQKRSRSGYAHVRHQISLVDSMEFPLDLDFSVAVIDLATNASVETFKTAKELSNQSFPQGYLFPSVQSGLAKLEMVVTSCSNMENLMSIQMSNGQYGSMIDLLYASRFNLPKVRGFYNTIDTSNKNKAVIGGPSGQGASSLSSRRDAHAVSVIMGYLRNSPECLLKPVEYPEGCLGEPAKPVLTSGKLSSYYKHLPISSYKNIHNQKIHVDQLLDMNRRLAISPAFLLRPLEFQKGEIVTLDIVIRQGLSKRCRQSGSTSESPMTLLGHMIVCYARLYDDVKIAAEVGCDEAYILDLTTRVKEFRTDLFELADKSKILGAFLNLSEKFTIDNILKLKKLFLAVEIDTCSQADWELWKGHEELVCCLILTLKSPTEALDVYATLHKISSDSRFTAPIEDDECDASNVDAPPPTTTAKGRGRGKGRGKNAASTTTASSSSNAFKLNEEDMFRCLRSQQFNKVLRLAALFTRTDSMVGVCATMIGRVLLADENQCPISGAYMRPAAGLAGDREISDLIDYHTPVLNKVKSFLEEEKSNYDKNNQGTGMLYEIEKMILDAIQIIPGNHLWDDEAKSPLPNMNPDTFSTAKMDLVSQLSILHDMRKTKFPTDIDIADVEPRPFSNVTIPTSDMIPTISSPSHFILKVLHLTRLDPLRWFTNGEHSSNEHPKMIPTVLDFETILHTLNVMETYSDPNRDALTSAWKTFIGYLDIDIPRCMRLVKRTDATRTDAVDAVFPALRLDLNDAASSPNATAYIGGMFISRQMFIRKALMSLHEYLDINTHWNNSPLTGVALGNTGRYNKPIGKKYYGKITPNKVAAILMMAYGTNGDPFWLDTMHKERGTNSTGADYHLFWLKVDGTGNVNKEISDVPVHNPDQVVIIQSGYAYTQALGNILLNTDLARCNGALSTPTNTSTPGLLYNIFRCKYIQHNLKATNGIMPAVIMKSYESLDETYLTQCHKLKNTAYRGMPIRNIKDDGLKAHVLQYEMLPLLQMVKLPLLAYHIFQVDRSIAILLENQWEYSTPFKILIDVYDHVNSLPSAPEMWNRHMSVVLRWCKNFTAMTKKRRDIVMNYVRFMQVFLCQHISSNGKRLDHDIFSQWCTSMKEKKPFVKELRPFTTSNYKPSRSILG